MCFYFFVQRIYKIKDRLNNRNSLVYSDGWDVCLCLKAGTAAAQLHLKATLWSLVAQWQIAFRSGTLFVCLQENTTGHPYRTRAMLLVPLLHIKNLFSRNPLMLLCFKHFDVL